MSLAGGPARRRKRTVPSLRGVAVSNRITRTGHRLASTNISLLSRRGRGTGGRRPARVTISPHYYAERARLSRPADTALPIHWAHSLGPFTQIIHREIHKSPSGISAFPVARLVPGRLPAAREPGPPVTSPQELLITVRAVIITVRPYVPMPGRAAARDRLSRRNFAYRKYPVTCGVRA